MTSKKAGTPRPPSRGNDAQARASKQHARFVEAAKAAEADEAPDAMDRAFKSVDPKKILPKR